MKATNAPHSMFHFVTHLLLMNRLMSCHLNVSPSSASIMNPFDDPSISDS